MSWNLTGAFMIFTFPKVFFWSDIMKFENSKMEKYINYDVLLSGT